jgi:hypothetical protein
MAHATYNPDAMTDKDWVRMLSGDRNTSRATLSDEEINALLAEEQNKYLAAARACEIILAKSGGLVEKQVGDLRLRYTHTPEDAYRRYVRYLREEGAKRTYTTPSTFRVLGSRNG